ncbi:MAG TPA: hypothetical protein DF383_00920, partial [Deltaproteobacteria bacterium]|nr:hypothetical protein [Deltaproteobacteria bacterium]
MRVNGILATSQDGFANWQAEIPLTPGENPLVVEAEDALSNNNPQAVTISVLSSGFLAGPIDVAVDDGFLYVLDEAQGAVLRIPETGGPAEVIFDNAAYANDAELVYPNGLVVDRYNVYVLDYGLARILSFPKEGGPATVFFENGSYDDDTDLIQPFSITMDDEFFYVGDTGDFDNTSAAVLRIPTSGGPGGGARIITTEVLWPADLAVDSENLYMLDMFAAAVIRFPKEGGLGTNVFHNGMYGDDAFLYFPRSLALDGDNLYLNDGGRLLRTRKEGHQPLELISDSNTDDPNNPYGHFFTGMALAGDDLYLTVY